MHISTLRDVVNSYPDSTVTIIGKGPTWYDYGNLPEIKDGPILFINDAAGWAHHAVNAPGRFFFAHDVVMSKWLCPTLKATPVLPEVGATDSAGAPMIGVDSAVASHAPDPIAYRWGGWFDAESVPGGLFNLVDRKYAARDGRLYINSGTIHSAIHFAWILGAKRIRFIGCDGRGDAYDERVCNLTGSAGKGVFGKIRRVQDTLCDALGLETEYVQTPSAYPRIPRIAHFVWLGDHPLPEVASRCIGEFAKRNPGWDVRVWRDMPDVMPEPLRRIAIDSEQLCMRADVFRYWLLWHYGGVYLDCDLLAVQSWESLRYADAWAWRQHDSRVNCCAMGSVPQSPAFTRILSEVHEADKSPNPRAPNDRHRTTFGPMLLTRLFGTESRQKDGLTIWPSHAFGPFIDHKTAAPFFDLSDGERADRIRCVPCGDPPCPVYGVHKWGDGGSSRRKPFGRADALAHRIRRDFGNGPVKGAEVGVLAGRMSESLLRQLPSLFLYMVDLWSTFDPESEYAQSGDFAAQRDAEQIAKDFAFAIERTAFAEARRRIVKGDSVDMADTFADSWLDFVFVDADHTEAGCYRDLAAYWPKIRPGGMLCGHDIDNPAGGVDFSGNPNWGVRAAVERLMSEQGIPAEALELGGETTWYVRKPEGGAA